MNEYSTQPRTGRYDRKQITPVSEALVAPVVADASLSSSTSVINDTTKSGKQEAAMVLQLKSGGLAIAIAIAEGSDPLDKWDIVKAGEAIVPA